MIFMRSWIFFWNSFNLNFVLKIAVRRQVEAGNVCLHDASCSQLTRVRENTDPVRQETRPEGKGQD